MKSRAVVESFAGHRVVLLLCDEEPKSMFIEIAQGFTDNPRSGYDSLIRAIGDVLIDAGIDINARWGGLT